MVLENGFTLIPPLVAIAIAVWKKNAILALIVGVSLTWLMNANLSPVQGVLDTFSGLATVVESDGNRRIIIFSLLIGALLVLMKKSGGVDAFIERLRRKNLVTNRRQASLLPSIIGTSIFTDTNLSMFTAGIASQNLFDKFGLSRARLAFLIDSTCSPVSILLLINGWGAYILGLLDGYQLTDTVGVLIDTIFYNFYPIIILIFVYYTAFTTKVYGPMRHSVAINTTAEGDSEVAEPQGITELSKARYLVLPMVQICVMTIALLFYSGNGDIRQGSGSWSVMWSIISAYLVLCVLLLKDGVFSLGTVIQYSLNGMKNLLPVVIILVLSFAFGDAVKAYGTGTYVSQLVDDNVSLLIIAPLLFITAGIMAFATGTSWGTFAVLIPIAIPLSMSTGLPPSFLVAAVLGGGIFGDHSSPISDSTIIASMASGCDHIEHVKTQLPYNLVAAFLTIVGYVLVAMYLI
ncbi:Na+/H+ antiporter NhaC family protein [Psychrobium sp. 1_MG-2023]|uniref:Na+/H+ antiporter NhaC family protein n=1 Tax=Psychrobium sp. 1_MG-2023 TaxID=3062624 RepID=UPI000C34027F|nr:Na+/H+ antiporter NhaC family protein [Psychrobium sp. 1_MG-2023]MDP2560001.1 Na+/H+ antiporter NhaC family protein [Psychrobium sp. 1_MG-2023]PKF56337.1 sodium:proton antiporter [Alteromonadales bacterium alter-6D02]